MKMLAGGCRVYSPDDGVITREGNRTTRDVVNSSTGAKRITQAVSDYAPGVSPAVPAGQSETVLYVEDGDGTCLIDGSSYSLTPRSAVYIPPGATYQIENTGTSSLRIVSSCCPLLDAFAGKPAVVREADREEIRAGEDRIFRYLIHSDSGCRQVTQFAGWIPPGKAPFHWHPYEEAIYVLEGHGILNLGDQPAAAEFGPGSSIYLPRRVTHCIENPGPAPIRLLGVFYPSGSPGEAYEDQ